MKIDSHIWISDQNGPIIGKGRYHLLLHIIETGSLSKACKAMNLSYKKAWKLVDSMNTNAAELIVETKTGGKNGGGTVVTDYGKNLMSVFEKALAENQKFRLELSTKLFEN